MKIAPNKSTNNKKVSKIVASARKKNGKVEVKFADETLKLVEAAENPADSEG